MTRPTGPYAWLNNEPGPRMLLEGLKLYGVLETPGPGNNPTILAWADEIGAGEATAYAKWAAEWVDEDAKAWCGLMMAVCAVRANPDNRPERRPPAKYLAALEWMKFGLPVTAAELGDVLVFHRPGGGHVGLYVGEDATAYHVLGGNQGDAVSGRKADCVGIARIARDRVVAIRRVPYLAKPANVRPIRLAASGAVSTNEA